MTTKTVEQANIPYAESRHHTQRLTEIEFKYPKLVQDLKRDGWDLVVRLLTIPGLSKSRQNVASMVQHAQSTNISPLVYLACTDNELKNWYRVTGTSIKLFNTCVHALLLPEDNPPPDAHGLSHLEG